MHTADSSASGSPAVGSRAVLALNRGSSSTKFGLFTLDPEPSVLRRGTIDSPDSKPAAGWLLDQIAKDFATSQIAAVGHRIVHGGQLYRDPLIVDAGMLDGLRQLVPFAPNHLPDEIALIEAVASLRPDTPQIVCFDTAFHADLPAHVRRLAIPSEYDDQGLRRYGFHGLSYAYLAEELRRRAAPAIADGRVVIAHLGNGSSLVALHGGRSMDTTMGFTPIGGIVMSTRSGDLDPGVVTQISRVSGLDADETEKVLSSRAGLWAISGGVSDMRDLLAREATDDGCRLAVAIYCYEIKKRIGAYAAALGGLDAIVFSGGIGEHASAVRERACDGLQFLGVEIDAALNAADAQIISTDSAAVVVHVIPTDEELVIARSAYRLIR